jgi:Flp pilus assembly protein TadD
MQGFLSSPGGGHLRCSAVLLFLLFASAVSTGQTGQASLHGTVRDPDGNTLAGVSIQLQKKDAPETIRVETDAEGRFVFPSLANGTYTLKAMKEGFATAEVAAVFVGTGENRAIDLTLPPANQKEEPATSRPQFFDEPQFSVAGVTDTTSLGGHGPDTVLQTRNTIAKDTVELGKPRTMNPAAGELQANREAALRKSADERPGDFTANHDFAKWLLDHGKANEALAYFERAARAGPSDYQNAYDLALANEQAGNYMLARDQAASLVAGHDNAELHRLLGDTSEKLGDSLQAVRQYERAAELEASEANLFDWGSELLLHHAAEPAAEVFSRGHRLFPRSERMAIALGASLFAQGSYEQAVRQICEASDLHPEDPVPYLFLGKMQGAEVAPSAEAIEKLHRFETLQPENAEANYYYAVGLWKLRKKAPDKASAGEIESLLKSAVRINPKAAPAHLQLGILHSEDGNNPGAIREFQLAAEMDPQMEEAHYRLAQAYREQGDQDKAREEYGLYQKLAKASSEKLDRERHEIKQFVYTLRDPSPPPIR